MLSQSCTPSDVCRSLTVKRSQKIVQLQQLLGVPFSWATALQVCWQSRRLFIRPIRTELYSSRLRYAWFELLDKRVNQLSPFITEYESVRILRWQEDEILFSWHSERVSFCLETFLTFFEHFNCKLDLLDLFLILSQLNVTRIKFLDRTPQRRGFALLLSLKSRIDYVSFKPRHYDEFL